MFQTEHGPSGFDGPGGGDEVNIVERGKNYGWPRIHHTMTQKNLEQPLLEYTPAIAPAGATFYKSNAIAPWHNNFFFACLRGQRLIRVVLDGRHVVSTEDLFHNSYGRIRDIIEGPDGALYFSTSNRDGRGKPSADDDRVMRIRY
jgi:glucose/arabinose dehydrogenase